MTTGNRSAVVIAATLDTKGAEVAFVRREFERRGVGVTVIDCGILGEPGTPATFTRARSTNTPPRSITARALRRDRPATCFGIT